MSRNRLMMLNIVVSFMATIVCAIMGMIEIRLLLQKYGEDINGLIQTGNQALGYLTLLEAGICAAFMYKMYLAIAEKNGVKLSELYNGFKKSMSALVVKMLILAMVVSALYPLFLLREDIGYFNMFSIFLLLSLKIILPYKVSIVPKYMIVLKEQKYKAELISGLSRVGTYLIEILLLLYTDWNIQILLLSCVIVAVVSGGCFRVVMVRIYKDTLDSNAIPDETPRHYSKSLMLHNISNLVFNSTDNVILSILGSLKDVTIYSSYNMIVGQISELAHKVISGATAGMGIKIAGREKNSYSVYRELLTGSFAIASIVMSVFLIMINDFITLWIGREYCVGNIEKIFFGIIIYCGILLPCLNEIRAATGKFKESTWYIVLQSVVNIVLTLILVPLYGLLGALIGTVIARIFVSIPCNYYIVEKNVFSCSRTKWYELFVGYVLVAINVVCIKQILQLLGAYIKFKNVWLIFIANTIISTLIAIVFSCSYYIFTDIDFRHLLKRISLLSVSVISSVKNKERR